MNKQRLVTFGCSFTAFGEIASWPYIVSAGLNLDYKNYAIPASSNHVQQNAYRQYIINSEYCHSDIIIWQVTCSSRPYQTMPISKYKSPNSILQYYPNLFDQIFRCEKLLHYDGIDNTSIEPEIEHDLIEKLLFYFISAKHINPKLLIVFGWELIFPSKQILKQFKELLKKHDIDYIDDSIELYSLKCDIPMLPCQHPSQDAYIRFAIDLVIPKLTQLQWINP